MVLNINCIAIDKFDTVNHAFSIERYAFLSMPVPRMSASPCSFRALGGLIMDLVHLDIGVVKWKGLFTNHFAFEDRNPHG